jgi:hypothetical protein
MAAQVEAVVSGYVERLLKACQENRSKILGERKPAITEQLQAESQETQIAFIKTVLNHAGNWNSGVGAGAFLGRVLSHLMRPRPKERQLDWLELRALGNVVAGLLRRKVPFPSEELAEIVHSYADKIEFIHYSIPVGPLISAIESGPRTAETEGAMRALKKAFAHVTRHSNSKDKRKVLERIDHYLVPVKEVRPLSGGPWSSTVFSEINRNPEPDRSRWSEVFLHCLAAQSSTPSRAWRKRADELIAAVEATKVKECALRWLDPDTTSFAANSTSQMRDKDADYLKGFIWLLANHPDPELSTTVANVGLTCLRKIPNIGPVSARVGFACVNVLAEMPGMEPVSQLSRMRVKIRYAVALKLIEKALNATAERSGMSRDDLEDIAVPNYGLDREGKRLETLGNCGVEVALEVGLPDIQVRWKNAEGKTVKSPPTEVKQNHSSKLKEIKRSAADMQKMLAAQRLRIEQFFINERKIAYEHWRRHFLHHPLMSTIARRLIWRFWKDGKETLGICHDGEIVNWNNEPAAGLGPETSVQLWHPLHSDTQTILSWRCWLEDHHVVQPFKQAHREVYILTPAEQQTDTYSNRFAAHVLRQHQFASLCRERGWQYRLMGSGFDGHNVPTLELPRRSMKAEFWVDIAEGEVGGDPRQATDQVSGSGINLYLFSDQVRFYHNNEQMRLAEVPPAVFSEIMRDVDLFVGVTSIGNDPTWADRGGAYGQYWHGFAFGDLSQSGETRRAILEKLLPQLKISSRCSLEGKFLVVRGDLRTYKIHLGSGNVLLEPGSRYLCIVPDRRTVSWERGSLYLPFDGDNTLAVILSKALLLAADKKITDQTILWQIGR